MCGPAFNDKDKKHEQKQELQEMADMGPTADQSLRRATDQALGLRRLHVEAMDRLADEEAVMELADEVLAEEEARRVEEVARWKGKVASLRQEVAALEGDVAGLGEELRRQQGKTARAYEEAEVAMGNMDAEFRERFDEAMHEKDAEIAELEDANRELSSELASAILAADECLESRHAREVVISEAIGDVMAKSKARIATGAAEVAGLHAEISKLHAAYAERDSVVKKFVAGTNNAVQTVAALRAEIAELERRLGECDDDLVVSRRRQGRGGWRTHMGTLAAGAAMAAAAASAAAFDQDAMQRGF